MTVNVRDRVTIGSSSPISTINSFKDVTANNPIGGEVLNSLEFDIKKLLSDVKALLNSNGLFTLDKNSLFDSLLAVLDLDRFSELGKLINELIMGLGNDLISLIQARVNRLLGFIANDSNLCRLLKAIEGLHFELPHLEFILAGFIAVVYDLCSSKIFDKLISGISDPEAKELISVILLNDVRQSGNTDLLVDILIHPTNEGIIPKYPWIIDVITDSVKVDNTFGSYDTIGNSLLYPNLSPDKENVDTTLNFSLYYDYYTRLLGGINNGTGSNDSAYIFEWSPPNTELADCVLGGSLIPDDETIMEGAFDVLTTDDELLYVKLLNGTTIDSGSMVEDLDKLNNANGETLDGAGFTIDDWIQSKTPLYNIPYRRVNCYKVVDHTNYDDFSTGFDIGTL